MFKSSQHFLPLFLASLVAFTGCSEGDDDTNLTFVEVFQPNGEPSGDVVVLFRLRDQDGRFANVFPQFVRNDVSINMTLTAASNSTVSLRADSFGVSHTVIWDSFADLGAGIHDNISFRVDAIGRDGQSDPGFSLPFVVNNTDGFRPIEGTILPVLTRPLSASVPNNQVFVGLGRDDQGAPQTASFLFSLATNEFRDGPTLSTFRENAQASRSARGILIAGGRNGTLLASAEEVVIDTTTPDGRVEAVGNLNRPRENFVMTSLADGRVVLSGGQDDAGLVDQLEIFSNGAFTVVATDPLLARRNHSATILLDGSILITGGFDAANNPLSSSALITVNGMTATVTATGNLNTARARQGAARLSSGQVVIVGGTSNQDASGALATAEIFTPSSGQFQPFVNNFAEARIDPTLIAIANEVTVLGGRASNNDGVQIAERIDVTNGAISAPRFPDAVNRTESAAFVMGNGLHVIVGGGVTPSQLIPFQPIVAEAFRSGIGMPSAIFGAPAFSFQGNTVDFYGGEDANGLKSTIEVFFFNEALTEIRGDLLVPRARHTIQRFDDIEIGRALIIGGRIASGVTNTCEIADTTLGTSRAVAPLAFARENHRSVRLFDGRVLVVGGRDNNGTPLSSAEVFDPVAETWATVGSLSTERADHQIAIVPTTGEVLVVGGVNAAGTRLNTGELFDPNTNSFRPVGNTMSRARQAPTLVTDGALTTIAVVGGDDGTGPQANADIFDPTTSTFTGTIPMQIARSGGTSVQYSLGNALIVGGTDGSGGDAGPELLELGTSPSTAAGRLPDDASQLVQRRDAIAINVGGVVVLLGGRTPDGDVLSGLEFFVP